MYTNSGPWRRATGEEIERLIGSEYLEDFVIVAEDDEVDSEPWIIATAHGGLLCDEQAANCQLITAAPDLLLACKAFVEAWKKSHQLEKTDIALRMAEAAIEKAEARPGRG